MKYRNMISGAVAGLSLLASGINAEPAIYRDNTMTIPAGALISDSKLKYYKDIVLQGDADGKLTVAAAENRPLVMVDDVVAQVADGNDPRAFELVISGNKSVPCVELEEVAVSRDGHEFTVVVAETVLGPAETCIAVLDPFEITVPLNTSDLEAGSYTVNVNNEAETAFELPVEDSLPE